MTSWRDRLSTLRKPVDANANSAISANSSPSGPSARPIGAIGAIGREVEASKPAQADAAGRQRMPGWSDAADAPMPGDWCGCCGRFTQRGGRWWREAFGATGWCCSTCHPPMHLMPAAVVEVRT